MFEELKRYWKIAHMFNRFRLRRLHNHSILTLDIDVGWSAIGIRKETAKNSYIMQFCP